MHVPRWIVARARSVAIAVLEYTDDTPHDVATLEDSAIERWRALVAAAAPSLLDGHDGDEIPRAEADPSSPRHARSTTAMFERFDGRHPSQALEATEPSTPPGARRDAIDIAPTAATWARQRSAPAVRATDLSSPRQQPAAVDTPVPRQRREPVGTAAITHLDAAALAAEPKPGPATAANETATHGSRFAALRSWRPGGRRQRVGETVAPRPSTSRATASPIIDAAPDTDTAAIGRPSGRVTDRVSAPHPRADGVAADRRTPTAHRRPCDTAPPALHRRAMPPTPLRVRMTTRPVSPNEPVPQGDAARSDDRVRPAMASTPSWPVLPPSPLDRDGAAPNRLPGAVPLAAPVPNAFDARWSAEQEAH